MNHREVSRVRYSTDYDGGATHKNIELGALLRIADATELMAADYKRLQTLHQNASNLAHSRRLEIEHLRKSRAGYIGQITKLKKQMTKMQRELDALPPGV